MPKTETIIRTPTMIRFSDAEREEAKNAAQREGLSLSAWVRFIILREARAVASRQPPPPSASE